MRYRPHRMYPGALLAQECCSYQAMTELLARIRGDLVVLVHSDRDCSNVLPKSRYWAQSKHEYKFLCTNLKEDEIVTGQGNAKLRRALELIVEAWDPALTVVLSTCPTVMIGDNIKNVSRKTGRALSKRISAQITHGLKPKSPAEVVDQCYTLLTREADLPAGVERGAAPSGERARTVNLVGMDFYEGEREEITEVLEAMGITVGVALNNDAHLDDFLAMPRAGFNVHPGPNMLLDFDKSCAERFGMCAIEVPLPFGVEATDRFYRTIADALGVPEGKRDEVLAARRQPGVDAIAAFRRAHADKLERPGGLKLAYNIGSVRSFDLRIIALEELGQRPFFAELGFSFKLLIQGPSHDENAERTGEVLRELGIDDPYVMFPAPGKLTSHLRRGECDAFFGTDFMRNELSKIALPFVHNNRICMGYDQVALNVAYIRQAMSSDFYERFEATDAA
jgi:nitrogenase molybdenum-iron protein alpha chain